MERLLREKDIRDFIETHICQYDTYNDKLMYVEFKDGENHSDISLQDLLDGKCVWTDVLSAIPEVNNEAEIAELELNYDYELSKKQAEINELEYALEDMSNQFEEQYQIVQNIKLGKWRLPKDEEELKKAKIDNDEALKMLYEINTFVKDNDFKESLTNYIEEKFYAKIRDKKEAIENGFIAID